MGPCPVTRCASTVSKCLITDACRCRPPTPPDTDCPCCVRCARCLGSLFSQCCGCVDMCALVNDTATATAEDVAGKAGGLRLTRDSQTSDVRAPVPGLFAAVIEREDAGWTTLSYPVGADPLRLPQTDEWDMVVLDASADDDDDVVTAMAMRPNRSTAAGGSSTHTANKSTSSSGGSGGDNRWRRRNAANQCTVAYAVQCMSLRRCRLHCAEMGASAVRWFYDGCCECVGPHCRGYGVDESRCEDCPMVRAPEVGVNGVLGAIPATVREALAATASSRMWPVREPEEEEALYAMYGVDDEEGDGGNNDVDDADDADNGGDGQPSFVGDTDDYEDEYDDEGDEEDGDYDEDADDDGEEDEDEEDDDVAPDYEEMPGQTAIKSDAVDNGDEDYIIPSSAANTLDETDYGAIMAPEKDGGSISSVADNAVEYDDYTLPLADSVRNVVVV